MKTILLYGGTFDPPHKAHLNTALNIQAAFHFKKFYFLPCKKPVLKPENEASTAQRVDMLKLALSPYKQFNIDLSEINRDTPSYMVETLKNLRHKVGENASITLAIGTDAFLKLPEWYCWEELIKLCHLLVIKRPMHANVITEEPLRTFIAQHVTQDKSNLLTSPNGYLFFMDAGLYDISSTKIRNKIKRGESVSQYLPASVEKYIQENKLYNPHP